MPPSFPWCSGAPLQVWLLAVDTVGAGQQQQHSELSTRCQLKCRSRPQPSAVRAEILWLQLDISTPRYLSDTLTAPAPWTACCSTCWTSSRTPTPRTRWRRPPGSTSQAPRYCILYCVLCTVYLLYCISTVLYIYSTVYCTVLCTQGVTVNLIPGFIIGGLLLLGLLKLLGFGILGSLGGFR